jgi:hypothetical protein
MRCAPNTGIGRYLLSHVLTKNIGQCGFQYLWIKSSADGNTNNKVFPHDASNIFVLYLSIIMCFGPGKGPKAILSSARITDTEVQAYIAAFIEIGCFSGSVRLFRECT